MPDRDILMDQLGLSQDGSEIIEEAAEPRRPYQGWTYSELKKRKRPPTILLTTTCLIPFGLVEIFGKPGTGKSLFAIELTACAAAGAPFHGSPLVGVSGRHLYLAAEGSGGIADRLDALVQRRGIDSAALDQNWVMVDKPINMNDQKTVDECLAANPGPWATVTIDTLAQSMAGDENSTQDMNEIVKACKYIRTKTECAALFLLHHEGRKADHARGSIALDAATDCQLRVFIDTDGRTCVEVVRLRDFAKPANPVTTFQLRDGLLEPDTAPRGVAALADREGKMRALLVKLVGDSAAGSVPASQWRAACAAAGLLSGSKDNQRQQWSRAVKQLKSAQCVKADGSNVQPCEPPAPEEFAEDFAP
jgi:AAA domain-containing protein